MAVLHDGPSATTSDGRRVDTTVDLVPMDLREHWNNTAVSGQETTGVGGFNVWRNTIPAEYLPEPGSRVVVGGVPFLMPTPTAAGDNIRCAGQMIEVPAGRYDWLHLLTASERRTEEEVAVHFADGQVDFEAVRVSDFWAAPASFGEWEAFRTPTMHYPHHVQQGLPASVWSQRVPVTRRADLTALRLPRNIALHVFALTVQTAPAQEQP